MMRWCSAALAAACFGIVCERARRGDESVAAVLVWGLIAALMLARAIDRGMT